MEQEKCEQSPLYKLRNCVTIWFFITLGAQKEAKLCGVKRSWEIIADNLSKAGWYYLERSRAVFALRLGDTVSCNDPPRYPQ
jgi:hypothetical protein